MPTMPAPKGPRPITVALNIVKRMNYDRFGFPYFSRRSHARLVAILTELNAASGTTDTKSAQRRRRTIARKKAAR